MDPETRRASPPGQGPRPHKHPSSWHNQGQRPLGFFAPGALAARAAQDRGNGPGQTERGARAEMFSLFQPAVHANGAFSAACQAQDSCPEQDDCCRYACGQENVGASVKAHGDPAPVLEATKHVSTLWRFFLQRTASCPISTLRFFRAGLHGVIAFAINVLRTESVSWPRSANRTFACGITDNSATLAVQLLICPALRNI